jgi:hypothetical protein
LFTPLSRHHLLPCALLLQRISPSSSLATFLLRAAVMGKRGSNATGAAGGAAKKAKTADADSPAIGNWVQTKIGDKELASAE